MECGVLRHIDYVVSLAGLEGHRLTKTRIVKFLYLAEILYLKHTKKRLTDWKWVFWDFGPFCVESLRAIEEAVKQKCIHAENYQSNFNHEDEFSYFGYPKDQYLYSSDLEGHIRNLEEGLHIMVKMGLRLFVREYANSTSDLLNYVYYNTEPMIDAIPRQPLDFSLVRPDEKVEKFTPAKISRKKEKKVMDAIKKMRDNFLEKKTVVSSLNPKHIDADYVLGMKMLNGLDEEDDVNETGEASIVSISKA